MFNRLGGLALSLSLSLLASSHEHVLGFPLSLNHLLFLLFACATFLRYGHVCFTFPVPCWAIPLERWQYLFYFLALCDSIVHDVCIYICLCVYGWLCTLYDGLLWLCEWPFLAISALDLVTWVCAQCICYRCIFMSYYVHSLCGVTVPIHVTKWH